MARFVDLCAMVVCFLAPFCIRSASAVPQSCSCSSKRCAGYYVHGHMFQKGSDVVCQIETNATGDEDLRHDRFLEPRQQQDWTPLPGTDIITSRFQPSTTDYPVQCLYSVTFGNGTSIECLHLSLPIDCGVPQAPASGSIAPYSSTLEGAVISYKCDQGFSPSEEVTATCVRDEDTGSGTWTPDPAEHSCTNDIVDCGVPQAPANGCIAPYSSTLEGAVISYQCDQGFSPSEEVTATCVRDEDTGNGIWTPDPAEHGCTGSETSLHLGDIVAIIFGVVAVIVGVAGCIWIYRKRHQAMEWFGRFGCRRKGSSSIQEEDQDRNGEVHLSPQRSRELADPHQRLAVAEEEKGDLKKKLAEAKSEIQELKKLLSERASGAVVESSPAPAADSDNTFTHEDQLSGQINKPITKEPCPHPVPSVQENTAAGELCCVSSDTSASISGLSSEQLITPGPSVPKRIIAAKRTERKPDPCRTEGASQPDEIQDTVLQRNIGRGEVSNSSISEDPGVPVISEERYDERKTKMW